MTKLEEIRNSPFFTSALSFILAGFGGWCVFNLQLISVVRLIWELGISTLPALMILQAGISWVLLRYMGDAGNEQMNRFFGKVVSASLAIVLLAQAERLVHYDHTEHAWWVLGGLYILSQLAIPAVRLAIHVIFGKRMSVLRNPQVSTHLAIAQEIGTLVGVCAIMLVPRGASAMNATITAAPFLCALLVFGGLEFSSRGSFIKIAPRDLGLHEKKAEPAEFSRERPLPFFGALLGLFSVVASLKGLQWFGMASGLAMAGKGSDSFMAIYSKLSLIQAVATLSILLGSLRFASKIPTWSVGFKVLLGGQIFFASVLMFVWSPIALMGGEVVRKVLEHGFLSRSLQLLTTTLPDERRLETRSLMERWSTTSGTAVAGCLAWVVMRGGLPLWPLWTVLACLGFYGLHLRRRLFETLSDFHVANLAQTNLGGVIRACYVLANPDSRRHHAALTTLLERNPRPIITKSILHALGKMQHPDLVGAISKYINADREDIQMGAVRALESYNGHEINFLLLKVLREEIRVQQDIRMFVIRLIAHRLGRLVVPYLIEIIEAKPDERVVANAVEILGEVAKREKDGDLMSYLVRFLSTEFPRRVRANTILALYYHDDYGNMALEAFDRLLTSGNSADIGAASFIAGALNLRGHESFIWEWSMKAQHRNITLLSALLRLRNPEAPYLMAHLIAGEDDRVAVDALIDLAYLPSRCHSSVLSEVITHWPHLLERVLARMRKTQRDFEFDRELLRDEARRMGLQLGQEEAWVQPGDDEKKAA